MDISCILLAGGKSSRLGHDKILEKIGEQSLLEKVLSCLESLGKQTIIVTAEERVFPQLKGRQNLKIVYDIYPGKGSLGGIYTGLVTSQTLYNFVVAADMPFLNRPLLQYMIGVSEGYDYVLPRVNDLFEPLCAIYSKTCLPAIESMIKKGDMVIINLVDLVKVRYVDAEEIDRFDPKHRSFFNINTRQDLALARELANLETADDKC